MTSATTITRETPTPVVQKKRERKRGRPRSVSSLLGFNGLFARNFCIRPSFFFFLALLCAAKLSVLRYPLVTFSLQSCDYVMARNCQWRKGSTKDTEVSALLVWVSVLFVMWLLKETEFLSRRKFLCIVFFLLLLF